jgi:hypothetical protein
MSNVFKGLCDNNFVKNDNLDFLQLSHEGERMREERGWCTGEICVIPLLLLLNALRMEWCKFVRNLN